ncbi:MAG: membrane-bound lytic murein transglycosylase D [Bacteroidetes bacterium]|nr:MAG: membrane-bound lytic murein transglycosylase D [Bacteroidota bacterium]
MRLLKTHIILFLLLICGSSVQAQAPDTLFADDPVAAMLDSLAHNKYISSLPKVPVQRNNKFNFAADSVPRYDDIVIESRLAKMNNLSPFDMVYNKEVRAYIDMYSLRKRKSVERMLGLAQLYYPIFEEKLDKYNLPLELKHLAVIESALNPVATSRSGARGLWQFMYPTGKMYGLEVSSYVDERCDPYQATEAACQYLQFLYSLFGDWQMVLAAYNSGPGTVNKAIRRAGGGKKTYWEIRPFLPKETQGYVPAFIGAAYTMTYAAEHNLYAAMPRKTYYDVDTVTVKQQVNFAQIEAVLGVPREELAFLNPMYKLGVIPYSPAGTMTLILPANKSGNFVTNEKAIYDYLQKDTTSSAYLASQQVMKIHTVKKGENINTIAKRYKCTIADVRTWNNLKSNYIKPGQKLTVYGPARVEQPATAAVASNTPANNGAASTGGTATANTKPKTGTTSTNAATIKPGGYYTIQRGDTLWKISQETGHTVDAIKKVNGFGSKFSLMPGQKIKLPTKA